MTHLWEKNSHEPSGNKATHFSCSSLPREVEVHGCVAQNCLSRIAGEKENPVGGEWFA